MSIGEDRVRVSFNPSANGAVDQIRQKAAELIDMCETYKGTFPEQSRCAALAQTAFEEGAMWAVKAAVATIPPSP